jgi:hypothetical protein
MDNSCVGHKQLYCDNTKLRAKISFVKALNSQASQVAVETADSAIARFDSNGKKSIADKRYPKFKKNCG